MAIHQSEFTDLRLSMAGIIFLGAPLQGSRTAVFGEWLARVSSLDTTLLKMLRDGSADLHALQEDFCGSYSTQDIVCFYEQHESSFGGVDLQVKPTCAW